MTRESEKKEFLWNLFRMHHNSIFRFTKEERNSTKSNPFIKIDKVTTRRLTLIYDATVLNVILLQYLLNCYENCFLIEYRE